VLTRYWSGADAADVADVCFNCAPRPAVSSRGTSGPSGTWPLTA